MSRFTSERLHVAVEPGRIVVVPCRGWPRPRPGTETILPLADGDSAFAGLDRLLAAWPGARAHVVLADCLVKAFVFESAAGLKSLGELTAAIQVRFEEIFGLDAADWEFSRDAAPFGSRVLVCAVERERLAALRRAFAGHRIEIASLRPFFVSEFNRWRRRIGRAGAWFTVTGRDALTLAWLAEGGWRSVRTYRVSGALDLPRLLARERLSLGIAADKQAVWWAGEEGDAGEEQGNCMKAETDPIPLPASPLKGEGSILQQPRSSPSPSRGGPGWGWGSDSPIHLPFMRPLQAEAPLAIRRLGQTDWPGRSRQWSQDCRLALSGIWP